MGNGAKDGVESAKIICAICYEDAKPVLEDLQSISLCGHVFHELCLQQWLEYCPSNKKATCPVCKHSCADKDIHRLYFQSTSEMTQQACSTQRSCAPDSENAEVLRVTVKKLECQLAVATAAMESQQNQVKDLSKELSLVQDRAQKAELARAKAIKDKVCFEETLLRRQEELSRSTVECSRLWEKNTALAKELAAHKLVANIDLEEDQVLKLACVGRGSNKDDIIDTLRKSLVIRNKSYKELMEKCNQLGMGENHSLKKLEKAFERIKRLRARVQELEKTLEEKDNASIRSLIKSNNIQFKADNSDINKSTQLHNFQKDLEPKIPLNKVNAGSQKSQARVSEIGLSSEGNVDLLIMQSAEMLPNFDVGNEGIVRSNENVNEHRFQGKERFFHDANNVQPVIADTYSYPLNSKCATPGVPHAFESHGSADLERVNENQMNSIMDEPVARTLGQDTAGESMGILDDNSFLPIKREAGLAHLGSLLASEKPIIGGSVVSKGVNGISGKWCSQAKNLSSSKQGQTVPSNGTFIAVGANGRGGKIKVFKNTSQSLDTGISSLWNRQPKRCKIQRVKPSVNNLGGLQIEHFFQKSSEN